ncbi:MAG: carboxypeptidase regulatory-like domain-containing protein [Bacteroidota bacterium]
MKTIITALLVLTTSLLTIGQNVDSHTPALQKEKAMRQLDSEKKVSMFPQISIAPSQQTEAMKMNDQREIGFTTKSLTNSWLQWDNGQFETSLGSNSGFELHIAARFEPSDLAGLDGLAITKIRFFPADEAEFTLKVWQGNGAEPVEIFSQPLQDDFVIGQMNEVTLSEPVIINENEAVWVGYSILTTGPSFPAGVDTGPAVAGKGDMFKLPGHEWGSLLELAHLNYNWIVGAYVEELADEGAPAAPLNFVVQAGENGVLTSQLEWTNPSVTFGGEPLTELQSVQLFRGQELVYTNDAPVPGQNDSFGDNTLPDDGLYSYTLFATNSVGNGPSVKSTVFIGNDVPAAPANVLLVSQDNNGLLSWEAPQSGLNGGYVEPNDFSYSIIRMPDETLLADNITENEFVDETVPGIGNYFYIVTASNTQGTGGSASSNTTLLAGGTALVYETFDYPQGTLPPGWSVVGDNHFWSISSSANAGGETPEMSLGWNPASEGTSRLVSPVINAAGQNGLRLSVKMYLDNFSSSEDEMIGIDFTTDGGQTWQTIWEEQLLAEDIPQQEYEFVFALEEDPSNLQVAFRFEGYSYNIDYWYIDDLLLQPLLQNDLAALSLNGSTTPSVGTEVFYTLTMRNLGDNQMSDYTVKLMGEEEVELASLPGVPVSTGEIVSFQLPWVPAETGPAILYGLVESEGDEFTANNTTADFSVQVQPEGTYVVQIGQEETFPDTNIPFDFFWNNSYTQTLYYSGEIGVSAGVITAVKYNNSFVNDLPDQPIRIWMGETGAEDLNDGFVDFESLTLVYEGQVSFPVGENEIMIELDNPFVYTGENLVLYTNKMFDPEWYSQWNRFFGGIDPDRNRSRSIFSDENLNEMPDDPGAGFATAGFPNTTLYFSLGGLGSLEGTVTNGNDSLQGVSVSLQGTNISTTTDENGFYRFPFLIPGTYTVEFDLFGYFPESEPGVVIAEEETTLLDALLEEIPTYLVSGTVGGNDGLIPQDIQILLEGYDNYSTTTSTAGAFVFNNVYEGVYKLTISAEGYEDYIEEELLIEQDSDLGAILLEEIILSPGSLAIDYDNFGAGNALLSWQLGDQAEFRYDNGTMDNALGVQFGEKTSVLGAAHPYDAEISSVSWFITDQEYADLSTLTLWVFSLMPDGTPDQDNLLFVAEGVPTLLNEWSSYELPEELSAPNGFFIGLGVDGFLGLGVDDGADPLWPFIPGTQFFTTNVSNESFFPMEFAGFEVNFLIRATGKNFGPIQLTKQDVNVANADAVAERLLVKVPESPVGSDQNQPESGVKSNKVLTGFNVFLEDMENPVAFVQEQEFLFTELPEGNLTAGVQSVYTSGVSEIVTLSFDLIYPVEVTVNLTTNSGDSVEGAMVTLTNEQESQYVYTADADASGVVIFPAVRKGLYTLSVSLEDFELLSLANTDIQENTSFDLELIESLTNPSTLMVVTEGLTAGQALFSWNNPIEGWKEGFESGTLPNGWGQIITNQNFTSGMPATWQITGALDFANPVIPREGDFQAFMTWNWFNQDEWLISPEFVAPMGELVFWSYGTNGSQFGDNYFVKISNDGGDSWTVLWNASDLAPGNNFYETPVVIDISQWAGQDVMLAWHADDGPDDVGMWYSWGIDDITVGGESMDLKQFNIARGDASFPSTNKALQGFNVYLDGVLVGENITDNQFLFSDLPLGNYEAGVQAIYTTGVSEIVTTPFEIHQSWALTLLADPVEGGSLMGSGFYPEGELVEIMAAAEPGYSFVHWTEADGTIISEDFQLQIVTGDEDRTLIAVFEQDEAFTLTFILDMSSASSFDPSGELVGVPGSMHNWQVLGAGAKIQTLAMHDEENMLFTVSFLLAPGTYAYRYFLNEGAHDHEWEEDTGREIVLDKDMTVFDVWGMLTSIPESTSETEVRLFPNPVTDSFFIDSDSALERIVIHNTLGTVLRDTPFTGNRINVSELPEGLYIIHLYDNNKRVAVKKVLKR